MATTIEHDTTAPVDGEGEALDVGAPDEAAREELAAASPPAEPLPDIARAFALRDAAQALTTPQPRPARPPIARHDSLDLDPLPRPRRAATPPAPRRPRFRFATTLGFVGCTALIGLMVAREAVATKFPRAARLYALAGLPVKPPPLRFDAVVAHLALIDGREFLVVEGDIANRARGRVAVPALALAVTDADGVPVYRWEAATGLADLEPGRAGRFRARLATPPPNGRNVVVRFADQAPTPGRAAIGPAARAL